MILLLQTLWPSLAVAGLLGVVFAALAGAGNEALSSKRPVRLGAMALVLLAVAVIPTGLVPGRFGLGLEIGALLCAAYAVGCIVGSTARAGLARHGTAATTEPQGAAPSDTGR